VSTHSEEETVSANIVPFTPPLAPRGVDPADQEQLDLLRENLVPPDVTEAEFRLFIRVANHSGLDPFRRQIYAVKRKGRVTFQTGIDGYRAIAQRSGVYAGSDDAVFEGKSRNKAHPGKATVTVWKVVAGLRCPFTASARWDEYVPPSGQDQMWAKMPHGQLAKCAEALALRKAFPEEMSGVYVEEEMARANLDDISLPAGLGADEEATEEEVQAERFAALPVNLKVVFTSWLRQEGWEKPYGDEALAAIGAKLDELDPDGRVEAAEEPCAFCGSSRTNRAVVDGVVRCQRRKDCDERTAARSPSLDVEAPSGVVVAPDGPDAGDAALGASDAPFATVPGEMDDIGPCEDCGSVAAEREVTDDGRVRCVSMMDCDRRRQDGTG
jgi:phage recombination protein Bet